MKNETYKLVKKEYAESKKAWLYQLEHIKTGARVLYFDRKDENKTFAITFQTLPENDTGVFHILEHSVLNGSQRFPVKEPFVAMLQSSMQTFLNAMTFPDKTVYPVSSRNEQDLFNLMQVYLDGVFSPLIYDRPEIFMQEGWHYEVDDEGEVFYNGVVLSEMKGEYADVDKRMQDETMRMLYPDTCYHHTSGGAPENITELTYEEFIDTHRRFYHPSNAWIILDGHMDIERFLAYIDEEYLSHFVCCKPDFSVKSQMPVTVEKEICYEAMDEEERAHMSMGKILCSYEDIDTIIAAKILADYLTGSNESPLKRAVLECGLAQDIDIEVADGIYQPCIGLYVHNTEAEGFDTLKSFICDTARKIANEGIDKEALLAILEHHAFAAKEVKEPYGIELTLQIMESWLYDGNPLLYVETEKVYERLRARIDSDYFQNLLLHMLGVDDTLSSLRVLPSMTKGEEDARHEAQKIEQIVQTWNEEKWQMVEDSFAQMQEWQMQPDSEEALMSLPHLNIDEIAKEPAVLSVCTQQTGENILLKVEQNTNGIVYANLYFDITDLTKEELRMANVLASCFGDLRTKSYDGNKLQTKIKGTLGNLYAKITVEGKEGDCEDCRCYFVISSSFLEDKQKEAFELLEELLLRSLYDEIDKIGEILMQDEYYLRQSLVSEGHMYALTKALSGATKVAALKEIVEGESYIQWLSSYVADYPAKAREAAETLTALGEKIFVKNRLFVGYSGDVISEKMEKFILTLPQGKMNDITADWEKDMQDCSIAIPSSVGFSAIGHNLYAMGGKFHGAYLVLSSLLSYGYLWNQVRVQGGAYGTGMSVKGNGDIFCYSYRDPDLEHTKEAYQHLSDALKEMLQEEMPLDDLIIGAVNMSEPLMDPESACNQACVRYLRGVTHDELVKMRREILNTSTQDILALIPVMELFENSGKYCKVGE